MTVYLRISEQQRPSRILEPRPLGVETDPSSDALWEAFAEGRSFSDVYQLWRDTAVTNPSIRQRAATILTAPANAPLPYTHPGRGLERLLHTEEDVAGERTMSLRRRLADHPQLAEECAAGILYWLGRGRHDGMPEVADEREVYAWAIRELLPVVSTPTADALFTEYPTDSSVEYVTLRQIVADKAIPDQYRDAALTMWLMSIEQMLIASGATGVHVERMLRPLTAMLEKTAHTSDPHDHDMLSGHIYNTAIAYLNQRIPAGQAYVHSYNVSKVAWSIVDRGLRYDFAWRHVQAQPNPYSSFRIRTEQDMALAQWLLVSTYQRKSDAFERRYIALLHEHQQWRCDRQAHDQREAQLWQQLRT